MRTEKHALSIFSSFLFVISLKNLEKLRDVAMVFSTMKRLSLISILAVATTIGYAIPVEQVEFRAHQGERFLAPQSSAEAVKKAFELGSDCVEFDVAMTNDGSFICLHDRGALKFYWGIDKPIAEVTKQDIENAVLTPKARKTFLEDYPNMKPTTLDDVLAVTPKDARLIVDIKRYTPTFAKEFDKAVVRHGLNRKNMILTRNFDDFRKISPEYAQQIEMNTTVIGFPNKPPKVHPVEVYIGWAKKHKYAANIKFISIGQAHFGEHFLEQLPSKDFFKKIKAAGYKSVAWSSDDPEMIKKLAEEYDVDVIYTNKASFMREYFKIKPPRKAKRKLSETEFNFLKNKNCDYRTPKKSKK